MPRSQKTKVNGSDKARKLYSTCNRCRLIDCASIHNYPTPNCPFQLCPACKELAELNKKIDAAYKQLSSLVRQRLAINSKINLQHDQLTTRLPLEIVTEIFSLVAETIPPYKCDWDQNPIFTRQPGLYLLGIICKKWRNITLRNPRLWAMLDLRSDHPCRLSLVEKWLHRSSEAPLSVSYRRDLYSGKHHSMCLRNVLKPHATRWRHVCFKGSFAEFYHLFNNLDVIIPVDTLSIYISDLGRLTGQTLQLKEPLTPRKLSICRLEISRLPLQLTHLTHLKASAQRLDEVLHIIGQGRSLISCVITDIRSPNNDSNLFSATTHIVHPLITNFELHQKNQNILSYITLPTLRNLHYAFNYDNLSEIDTLSDFLDRSGAALNKFSVHIEHKENPPKLWLERLPSITHLNITFKDDYGGINFMIFIGSLVSMAAPLILPQLQELYVKALYTITASEWHMLLHLFKIRQNSVKTVTYHGARPLRLITIDHREDHGIEWFEHMMKENVLATISEVKALGLCVELRGTRYGHDFAAFATEVYNWHYELPFSGVFDNDSDSDSDFDTDDYGYW